MSILPSVAAAGPLTQTLREGGALGRGGAVREVVVESDRTTILSRLLRLRLFYDGPDAGPPSLILKTGRPERIGPGWSGGRAEVAFYTDVAPSMTGRSVPRCFAGVSDPDTHDWHILLEDLTDTHRIATAWPLPPDERDCGTIVETLARCHAAWWNDARLGVTIGPARNEAARDAYLESLARAWTAFADRLGDRLTGERRTLYETLLAAAPRLLAAETASGRLTVIHGDAHAWNVLLPRDPGGTARLFDWDAWRVGPAAADLAYLMALHWYPDHRRRLEPRMLDRYHAMLRQSGVDRYDRSLLADDYRRAVLWKVMTPVWQCANDIPPVIWWNHYERIMLAVDDLDCRALLA